jgi:hypothetical protein
MEFGSGQGGVRHGVGVGVGTGVGVGVGVGTGVGVGVGVGTGVGVGVGVGVGTNVQAVASKGQLVPPASVEQAAVSPTLATCPSPSAS